MIFPITDLLDDRQSQEWLRQHFHPEGLRCPKCGSIERRTFRETRTSRLSVYRCLQCGGIYNLYSGTLFEKKHLRPSQVVMLLRGVAKGESSMRMAEEVGMSRTTVHGLRKELQDNAQSVQPDTALTDEHTETDEMLKEWGGKKVSAISIPMIRPEAGPTSAGAMSPTKTTDHRSSAV